MPRSVFAIVVSLLLGMAGEADAWQSVFDSVSVVETRPLRYPVFDRTRELTLTGVGIDLVAAGNLVPAARHTLPAAGLDPNGITLGFDRSVVGRYSARAGRASDLTLDAAALFPLVLAFATPSGPRWRGLARTTLVYAETVLISGGLTQLGKRTIGRARPMAYLGEAARPVGFATDPPARGTFHSMPSGHSAGAWTGASMAVTDFLLRRPDATWASRFGVGLVGGAFASATSALRVRAGVHFPSDVVAGAGIGIVTGIVVPITHRGESPLPSLDAWAQALGGTLVGTALGILFANSYR